jgi:hypothetical protein
LWRDDDCVEGYQNAGRKRCSCNRMSRMEASWQEVRGAGCLIIYTLLILLATSSRQTSAKVFQAGYQRRRSKPACPPGLLRASPGTCIYSSTKEATRTTERHGNPSRSDEGRHSRCVARSGTDCFSGKAEGPDYRLPRYWRRKNAGKKVEWGCHDEGGLWLPRA